MKTTVQYGLVQYSTVHHCTILYAMRARWEGPLPLTASQVSTVRCSLVSSCGSRLRASVSAAENAAAIEKSRNTHRGESGTCELAWVCRRVGTVAGSRRRGRCERRVGHPGRARPLWYAKGAHQGPRGRRAGSYWRSSRQRSRWTDASPGPATAGANRDLCIAHMASSLSAKLV